VLDGPPPSSQLAAIPPIGVFPMRALALAAALAAGRSDAWAAYITRW
jgi:hypothetical protein